MARYGAVAAAAIWVGGCVANASGAQGPSPALRAYAGALRAGDSESAWRMLDDEARRGRTFDEHAELMDRNAAELRVLADALGRAAARGEVEARARVRLATGEIVVLVLEDGHWHMDGGVLDASGLGTPLDTIAAFRRALMRRDLRSLQRVLSRQTRAELEAEIERVVDDTAERDDLEVDIRGNRARVRLSSGGSIELVRESGQWRVVDVHEPPE